MPPNDRVERPATLPFAATSRLHDASTVRSNALLEALSPDRLLCAYHVAAKRRNYDVGQLLAEETLPL